MARRFGTPLSPIGVQGCRHTSEASRFRAEVLGGQDCRAPSPVGRIPQVPDTQSERLLLSFCAAGGANFFLRQPTIKASGSVSVESCSSFPTCGAQELSSLPMWEGGVGFRSARRTQPAAQWASWAEALKMVKERHLVVADTILGALESGAETSSTQAILKCTRVLHDAGFESPAWGELAEGRAQLRLSRRTRIPASLASGGSSKPVLRSRGIIARFQCGRKCWNTSGR